MRTEATAAMGDSNHVILVFIKAKEWDSEKPNTVLLLKNILYANTYMESKKKKKVMKNLGARWE